MVVADAWIALPFAAETVAVFEYAAQLEEDVALVTCTVPAALDARFPKLQLSTWFVIEHIPGFGDQEALKEFARVTRPGSLWVVSILPSGTVQTRLTGVAGQGVDSEVSYGTAAGTPGKVTFFAGRVPVVGERVTVSYRSQVQSPERV